MSAYYDSPGKVYQQDDRPAFRAVYELTTRPRGLSKATGGAGQFQFATIYHGATAAKHVQIEHAWVTLVSSSAAAWLEFQLWPLTNATTPATGNPAITAQPTFLKESGSEATCLALPTTGGTLGSQAWSTVAYNVGITGAVSTVSPPPAQPWVDLVALGGYEDQENPRKPDMRPLNAEGWAVVLDASASTTAVGLVVIEFTESTDG